MARRESSSLLERILAEWPAVLAVLVLIGGHVYLTGIRGEDLAPLGIPLFAAIVVFVVAEIARRVLEAR